MKRSNFRICHSRLVALRERHRLTSFDVDFDIFVNCKWVLTRWQ